MMNNAEKISQKSIWNVSTPSDLAMTLPFYGLESGHFYAEKDYLVAREYHDSFLFLFCILGTGIVSSNNLTLSLSPGSAVLLDCHAPHSYHTKDEAWEFLWIHFNGAMAKTYYDLVNDDNPRVMDFTGNEEFLQLFSSLSENLSDKDVSGSLHHSLQIERLLMEAAACRNNSGAGAGTDWLDGTIKKAVEMLRENYSSSVSLDDLCKELHISKYHFVRSFKKVMGIPPYAFLVNYRITQAKRLLVQSPLTIEEIAERTGFKDSAGFIASFKSHVGETPLHYRKEHFEVI